MLVWRLCDTWTFPVEDLSLTPDQRTRLLQAADAMAEAGGHRLFCVPGAWCALGADPFSPALLPTDAPRRGRAPSPGCSGPPWPTTSRPSCSAARSRRRSPTGSPPIGASVPRTTRLACSRPSTTCPPPQILAWRRGTTALALSALLPPDRILPIQCLAVVHRR